MDIKELIIALILIVLILLSHNIEASYWGEIESPAEYESCRGCCGE